MNISDVSNLDVQSQQRITEWRGSFGSGAVKILENIWITKGIKTLDGRKKYARHMLGPGLPFTYLSYNSKQKVRHITLCCHSFY
jgi:hypothetical protein